MGGNPPSRLNVVLPRELLVWGDPGIYDYQRDQENPKITFPGPENSGKVSGNGRESGHVSTIWGPGKFKLCVGIIMGWATSGGSSQSRAYFLVFPDPGGRSFRGNNTEPLREGKKLILK